MPLLPPWSVILDTNLLGTVANQGQMSLYDDNYSNVGNPTGLFKDAKSIWLNEKDNAERPTGFGCRSW